MTISGRGTVVTGRVDRGMIRLNEEVEIVGYRATTRSVVTGIEMFHGSVEEGQAGDNLGLLLRGIRRDDVERGQSVCKPGSLIPHQVFKARVYILSETEGGRSSSLFKGYRLQFYFGTADITGDIDLLPAVRQLAPGDNGEIHVTLIRTVALEVGTRFAIREGGRTVGDGVVTDLIG
jgi:elongation factor Tu